MDLELRLSELETEIAGYQAELTEITSIRSLESENEEAWRTKREAYVQQRIGEIESQRQIRLAQLHALEVGLSEPRRRLSDTTNDLIEHLKAGNVNSAREAFVRLAEYPLWLEAKINHLHTTAFQARREPALFDLFFHAGPKFLTRLKLIAKVAALGVRSGRRDQAMQLVGEVRDRADQQIIRFGPNDLCRHLFPRAEIQLRRLITQIKYQDLGRSSNIDLFSASERIAERLDVDPSLTEHLYLHRTNRSLDFAEWLRRYRTASCLAHLIDDRPRSFGQVWRGIVPKMCDVDALHSALEAASLSDGGLLMTFHGGFSGVTAELLLASVPNSVIILRKVKGERVISAMENPGAALMTAVRAALEGKTILMAPDGLQGIPSHNIDLLGRSIPMAIGAALIAYESGCGTGWYTVVPQGARLVPIVLPGPKAEKQESFDSFSARCLAFFQDRICDVMTGDPSQIALLARWSTLAMWDRPNVLGRSEKEINRKGKQSSRQH